MMPFDLHIHDLDLIVSLYGKPETFSYTSVGGAGKGYKEHYRFLYSYPEMNVAAEAAWYNADFPFTARWRVYFENALVVNDGSHVVAYRPGLPPQPFDTKDPILIPTGINIASTGMFYRELSHFIDCIRRGVLSDKVPQQQILTVIELLEEITSI